MPIPWERKPREPGEAHEAFLRYRDLGPTRTLERLNRTITTGKPQCNLSKLKAWSTRFGWVERCRLWDNHIQERRDREAARRAAELERRRQRELDDVWEDAMALRAKVRDMLVVSHIRRKVTREEKDDEGRVVVQHITLEPARWAFRDLAVMAKAAAELASAVLHAAGKDVGDMNDAELCATAGDPSGPDAGEPGQ